MAENLLRKTWTELDQAELRVLLEERIGRPGQYDGADNVLHLPLAREQCKVSLTFKGSDIVVITPGAAFDSKQWDEICAEIEGPILNGPSKVGRAISFNTHHVEGSWQGQRSGLQILPAPDNAPRATESAHNPFILEFPIRDAGLWPITNRRRIRAHGKLTLLLNLLLIGRTESLLYPQRRNFWAHVQVGGAQRQFQWVSEWYDADIGEIVVDKLSTPAGAKLVELQSDEYYNARIGLDGQGLRIPDDLDDSVYLYQNLSPPLQAKFDRAAYWFNMARRQWEDSMSASFASLVSAAEALTVDSVKHFVRCPTCEKDISHDAPGATEKFRSFFEQYTPDPGLKARRNKMYEMRSDILHGSALMQLDQGRAFGWDPPWWNEREMNEELWGLLRTAVRNWLKDPT